ncbi:MAG: hypothetical protein FAZ92_01827 [Accumulibacter sp.]|nr:MAG: hypothetical protein FAZ92_01827 [Accumulibacter sp.]
MHGEQHAPVHRLQAIARVGQRPPDDDAHGVVEIRAAHLVFETDRQGFLGEGFHLLSAGDATAGPMSSSCSSPGFYHADGRARRARCGRRGFGGCQDERGSAAKAGRVLFCGPSTTRQPKRRQLSGQRPELAGATVPAGAPTAATGIERRAFWLRKGQPGFPGRAIERAATGARLRYCGGAAPRPALPVECCAQLLANCDRPGGLLRLPGVHRQRRGTAPETRCRQAPRRQRRAGIVERRAPIVERQARLPALRTRIVALRA